VLLLSGRPNTLNEHYLQELAGAVSGESGKVRAYAMVCRGSFEAAAIRRAVLRAVPNGVVFAMPVYTFDQLISELGRRLDVPAARPIGQIQRELLVAECLAQHAAAGAGSSPTGMLAPGRAKDGVARSLAELFVAWDEAGADPDALLSVLTAHAAHAAHGATCPSAGALEALAIWRRYLEALRAVGRAERGQSMMAVVRALRRQIATHGFERIRVVGFPWLTGCEAKLVSALARSGADVEVELRHDEPGVMERIADIVSPASVRSVPLAATPEPPCLIAVAGPRREARAVAREIKKLVTGGTDPSRVWVASADSEGFTPELLEAFHEYGVPCAAPRKRGMKSSPLIADCLKLAALIAAEASHHRRTDIIPLVGSAYLGAGPEQAAAAVQKLGIRGLELTLAAWARRLGRSEKPDGPMVTPGPGEEPEPQAAPDPTEECIGSLSQAVAAAHEVALASSGTGLAKCAIGFREALHQLGLPARIWSMAGDTGLRVEEWQAWTAFERLLSEVASADLGPPGSADAASSSNSGSGSGPDSGPAPDWDEFLSALDFAAGQRSFSLGRPMSTGVVVTGINRAASVSAADCDVLFLCGLGDQWLPSRRRRPWILDDADVRAITAAGFGSEPLGDAATADRHVFSCAARSGVAKIYMTWSTSTDDGAAARRSFLVDEHLRDLGLDEPAERAITTVVSAAEVFPGSADQAASTREARLIAMHTESEIGYDEGFTSIRQRWSARKSAVAADAGQFNGLVGKGMAAGRREWSERSLNAYASCPFKFFCDYMLRIRAVDEVTDDIDARDRGTMLHDVVRRFIAELGGKPIDAARADYYSSRITQIATEVFRQGECERSSVPGRLCEAFYSGIAQKLIKFVESEVNRAVATSGVWSPHRLEWAFGRRFDFPVEVEVGAGADRVSVMGVIDRIDVGPDGALVIYDYKSGTAPSSADVKAGIELQLGLYALAAQEQLGKPVAAAWYIQLPAKGRTSGVFRAAYRRHLDVKGKQGAMSDDEWERFMDSVRHRIARCDQGEQDGEFAPTPSDRACRYCDYSCICRASYADNGESGE
jgi:ATP-dependent helicase/nuclease subunit B